MRDYEGSRGVTGYGFAETGCRLTLFVGLTTTQLEWGRRSTTWHPLQGFSNTRVQR